MLSRRNTLSPASASANVNSAGSKPYGWLRSCTSFQNYKPFLGLFYSFCSAFFSIMTLVFVQKLSYMNAGQLSLIRNTAVWAGSLPIAVYCVREILGRKEDRLALFLRGFLVGTITYLNTIAAMYLPLAEVAIVSSTMPVVVTVMARVYLKESCGLMEVFALLFSSCGVLLSVRLPQVFSSIHRDHQFDSSYFGGLAAAFASVIIFAINYVALRKLRHVHYSVLLSYSGLIGMIINGSFSLLTTNLSAPLCGWDQISVIVIGVFSFFRYGMTILAVQIEKAGLASIMVSSIELILGVIFQIIFFNLYPDVYTISGACFVLFSLIMIGFKKWLGALPEESETRKRFKSC